MTSSQAFAKQRPHTSQEQALSRAKMIVGGLAVLLVVVVAGLLLSRFSGRSPEGDPLLTATPNAGSFAPRELPSAPVLVAKSGAKSGAESGESLAVDFGYKVAGTAYSYTLALRFPADADEGAATLTVRHAGKSADAETKALRLWDAPRDAYAVAVKGRPEIDPAVPALCLKAVIGPSRTGYELSHASLCVAQLDGKGICHPETLACGQIRSKS